MLEIISKYFIFCLNAIVKIRFRDRSTSPIWKNVTSSQKQNISGCFYCSSDSFFECIPSYDTTPVEPNLIDSISGGMIFGMPIGCKHNIAPPMHAGITLSSH